MATIFKFHFRSILYACFALSFFACEEIPIEIKDIVIEPTEKVVVIEELTGAKCPNCPKGTQAINNILNKFPQNIIVVGIHGSFLAEPAKSGDPDLRNEDAKNLENWFKPWFGKPSASINRIKDNFDYFVHDAPDLWESLVQSELQKPLDMNLFMDVKYDENTRQIDVEVGALVLNDLPGEYNISVFLTESHIIAGQANGNEIIPDYEHNHVLRKTLTNFAGDFFDKDLTKGKIIKKNFTYTLPDVNGKLNHAEHTSIVAFVHKSGATTRDIVQGVTKYLVE